MLDKDKIEQWIVDNDAFFLGIDISAVLGEFGVDKNEKERALLYIFDAIKEWNDKRNK
jgi:hypothetical protein